MRSTCRGFPAGAPRVRALGDDVPASPPRARLCRPLDRTPLTISEQHRQQAALKHTGHGS
ncbi:toxin-antitoxin system, antitoxin component, ArsR domain protein [Actinomyces johnsonii F0542]|uniref:Toxin-antitoxin system, antitoxin component, ArsR domain protein n=1 Tax=Actinomyces johnsonii F0542 TaxID=1321818 RepID=U1QK16_9ACTO|nr:toxin-antitoxin system, antitoxin component, ArsR domain protein [Actinomyces johnsonii F0542]